jgi:membrane associated rhomboid family serine protease
MSLSVPQADLLGFSTTGLLQGQFWTLITSMFVHVDLFHLAVNMFFLYLFGNALEEEIGARRTTAIFFTAGIVSLIAGIPFYSPETHIVGSSIAVSALVGAGLVVVKLDKPSSPLLLFAPLGLVAMVYIIFNVFMLLNDQSGGVAWPSHVIGFFMGVVFGLVWRGRAVRTSKTSRIGLGKS